MAQDFNAEINRFNGTDYDTVLPRNSLTGTADPTSSTKGLLGQFYLNTSTNPAKIWQCVGESEGVYSWKEVVDVGGKRTARFTVGTSTAGWTAADCDYLCDGTADDVEINAALNALPAGGGEVVILDGTYNITASINIPKNNVSIRGNGNSTILKRMYDSSVNEGIITLTGRSGSKISNLQLDGNKASYTNSNNHGIYLDASSDNSVTSNTCNNSVNRGITLSSSSSDTIAGNTCDNDSYGIGCSENNSSNIITGNTCRNNVSGGILINSGSHNTITENTCNNNLVGIILTNSSENNIITGNTCIRGTGQASDYTVSQHTIRLISTSNNYNLIAVNNCMGKAVTNGGGVGNTIVNNKFDET